MPVFLLMRGLVGLGGSIPSQPQHHLSAMRKPLGRWEPHLPTLHRSRAMQVPTPPAGHAGISTPENFQMAIPIAQSIWPIYLQNWVVLGVNVGKYLIH